MRQVVLTLPLLFAISLFCPMPSEGTPAQELKQAIIWNAEYGDQAWAKLNFGYALLEAGRAEEALKAFESAHRKEPQNAEVLSGIGYCLLQMNKPAQAALTLEKAVALNPSKGDYSSLGDSYFAARQVEKALDAYERGIAAGRDIPACQNGRGYCLTELGRNEEAAEAFREAAKRDPSRADLVSLGYAESTLGRHEEALEAFERALKITPENIEAQSGKGFSLLALDRPVAAEKAFRQLVRLAPGRAESHNALAYALERRDRRGEALKELEKAQRLDPEKADLLSLAYWRSALGDERGALAAFDEALSLNPGLAEAQNGRGYSLAALGRKEESLEAFRTALILEPSAKNYSSLAYGLIQVGNFGDAIEASRRALRLDPNNEEAWMTLGEAALNLDDGETAREAKKALLSLGSPRAEELRILIDEARE